MTRVTFGLTCQVEARHVSFDKVCERGYANGVPVTKENKKIILRAILSAIWDYGGGRREQIDPRREKSEPETREK